MVIDLGRNNEILNKDKLDPAVIRRLDKTFDADIKFDYERPSISEQLRKLEVNVMPEEVKEILRERNRIKSEERKARKATLATYTDDIDVKPTRKSGKLPIYEDKDRQNKMLVKYPWIAINSFRPDPKHKNGTLLDIKCKCGSLREIHSCDAFQIKLCKKCKEK